MDTESSRENISWSKWMVEHKHTVCIEWMIMNDLTKTHGLYSSHIALFVDQVPKSLVLLLSFLYFIRIWPLRHHSSQHAIFCLQPALQTTFPIMSNRCNIKDCKIDTTCKLHTYTYRLFMLRTLNICDCILRDSLTMYQLYPCKDNPNTCT